MQRWRKDTSTTIQRRAEVAEVFEAEAEKNIDLESSKKGKSNRENDIPGKGSKKKHLCEDKDKLRERKRRER